MHFLCLFAPLNDKKISRLRRLPWRLDLMTRKKRLLGKDKKHPNPYNACETNRSDGVGY